MFGMTAQQEYYFKAIIGGRHPLLNQYWSMKDHARYMNDYMRNRGLSWDQIRYPTMTTGYSGVQSSVQSTMNFVSSNIKRLYR